MAEVSTAGFLETLHQLPLLEAVQRRELPKLSACFHDPRALAAELIRRGWLTPFQVNQIFLERGHELVLAQYVLLERLGEGGMGQVYKARQRNLDRIVAIKLIRKKVLDHPKIRARFEREIQLAAQLSHPNIVHAFDAEELDGTYFFVMEYVNGIDLSRLVKQRGPLPVAQACDYMRQSALGLQHAHERGMIHRDVKPANLLVTFGANGDGPRSASGLLRRPGASATLRPPADPYPWGLLKLLDLGLARGDEDREISSPKLTQLGSVVGTPDFLAPEQARDSGETDVRSDLYSLGCTFYYVLCGQVPFPGGSATDKLIQHQYAMPAAVEDVRRARLVGDTPISRGHEATQVPLPVRDLLQFLLAKDPDDRPQTAAEVAASLGELATRGLDAPALAK